MSATTWQRAYEPRARRAVADLARFAAADERRARRALDRRLATLRSALWSAPAWRARLEAQALSPDDLRSLDDLASFPVLQREDLARDGAGFVSRPDELFVLRSSGSTGEPLTVYRDAWETLHMWAVLRFWLQRLGVALPERPRIVLLCSLPSGIALSRRVPLLGGVLHRIAIVRGDAAERLRRVRPAVVFSDPAGLQWLARQDVPWPRLLLSSAQHLWPDLRARLPVPVVNYYATTETGPIAWECLVASGRFHVLLPEVWVEDAGGRLLVTRLRRSPWPLLRYATGDDGRVARDECACGTRGWSISSFAGRGAVAFTRPDGTHADAWQLAWVFKDAPLSAFRLTQTAADAFRLEAAGDAAGVVPTLRRALAHLGWADTRVDVRPCPPPRAAGDKPQPFVGVQAAQTID